MKTARKGNSRRNLIIIYVIAIVLSAASVPLNEVPNFQIDSISYVRAWKHFCTYGIDSARTPLYPFYLGMMKALYGKELSFLAAVVGQYLICFVSLFSLYRLVLSILKSEKAAFFSTLFYIVLITLSGWNSAIMTESLAMSGTIFYLHSLICFFRSGSHKPLFISQFILFCLLMLRPSFIYMIPVTLVEFIIYYFQRKQSRKASLVAIGSLFIVVLTQIGYMTYYYQKEGIFATNNVGLHNQYFMCREYGVLDPTVIKDKRLRDWIIQSARVYGKEFYDEEEPILPADWNYVLENYSLPVIQQAVSASIKKNFPHYIYRTLVYSVKPINDLIHGDRIAANTLKTLVYLMLLIYTVLLVRYIVKRRSVPIFSLLVYMTGVSNMLVAICGAMGGWGRLVMPSLCTYVIMFVQLALLGMRFCFKNKFSTSSMSVF